MVLYCTGITAEHQYKTPKVEPTGQCGHVTIESGGNNMTL